MNIKEQLPQITPEEMKAALVRSGYLLEQRVVPVFERHEFLVEYDTNFVDDEAGGKIREFDIYALNIQMMKDYLKSKYYEGYLQSAIVCECENNAQPVVFFKNENVGTYPGDILENWIKCGGYPQKIWPLPGELNINNEEQTVQYLFERIYTGAYHHYAQPGYATQYCSFSKKKNNEWIALHEDQQHQTLEKVLKATVYLMKDNVNDYNWNHRSTCLTIFYPLIILQGDMYLADIGKKSDLRFKKINHIKFIKKHKVDGKPQEFVIDIIQEKYLPRYLKQLNKEMTFLGQDLAGLKSLRHSVECCIKELYPNRLD